LRQGHTVDPGWAFDAVDEVYLKLRELDAKFAAGLTFGPARPLGEELHESRAASVARDWLLAVGE
jgi:hypothetical protein